MVEGGDNGPDKEGARVTGQLARAGMRACLLTYSLCVDPRPLGFQDVSWTSLIEFDRISMFLCYYLARKKN